MSVVRGRPPGLAGGIRGTRRAYCSSLRACPAPKSPTKARLCAVHMVRLQERSLLPEPPTSPSVPPLIRAGSASQTASQQSGTAERQAMIDRSHELPITSQARALNISRSGVYYRPQAVPAADLAIMRRMDELHLDFPFAGSRMLRDLLNAELARFV